MEKIIVGGACLNQIPFHWDHNINNIINAVLCAKTYDIDVLCLPELSLTGYGCEDLFLSEWLPEKCILKLDKLLPCTKNILTTIGLPLKYKNRTIIGAV